MKAKSKAPEAGRTKFRWSPAKRKKARGRGSPMVLVRVPKPLLAMLKRYAREHEHENVQAVLLHLATKAVGYDGRRKKGTQLSLGGVK